MFISEQQICFMFIAEPHRYVLCSSLNKIYFMFISEQQICFTFIPEPVRCFSSSLNNTRCFSSSQNLRPVQFVAEHLGLHTLIAGGCAQNGSCSFRLGPRRCNPERRHGFLKGAPRPELPLLPLAHPPALPVVCRSPLGLSAFLGPFRSSTQR